MREYRAIDRCFFMADPQFPTNSRSYIGGVRVLGRRQLDGAWWISAGEDQPYIEPRGPFPTQAACLAALRILVP